MSIVLTVNGTAYQYPEVGDQRWGTNATDWATAITNGCLQKAGGAFTLLSEVDFGASYGAKALYLKSRTSNPSSTGIIRLANGDNISFRNFANGADIALSTNASDQLTWNGVAIQGVISVTDTATIDLTLTGSAISADIKALSIDNSMISASAAIDATKIADGTVTSTEFQYINTLSSNAQTQIDLKAPLISPSFTTPSLGVATATSINGTSIPNTKTLVVTTDKISVLAATTSAELAGVISDETGSGALVFANTPTLVTPELGVATATSINGSTIPISKTLVVTTDKLSALAATTSSELAGVISDETGSGALVFGTAPTLTSPAINTATITTPSIVTPSRLDMKQDTLSNLTTYASTAADGQLCFATDTKATYVVKNSSLSSVGGAGAGINYILAPDADSGSTGWATYADAAATSPVDGTGGSPSSTFAVSASSPLRGTSSFLWTKSAANRQGEGFSYDFTIDASDKGKVLQCSFEYQIASGTFADNDLSVWIYDVTNASLIQPAPYLIKNSGIIEKFAVEFQTASNSTSYRLIVHVGSTSASAYTVKLDNVVLGPQAKLYGSAVTDWVSYAPNVSSPGVISNLGKWRRVGDSMEVEGYIEWNGSGGGGTLLVDIPSGFAIDTSKISFSPGRLGNGQKLDNGVAYYELSVVYSDSNSVRFMQTSGSAYQDGSGFTAGDQLKFNFRVPIQGWSSSQVFSQDADVRVVAALIGGGTASATANNPIIYSTVGLDTHGAYSTVTGKYTVPVSGYYNVNASGDGTAAAGTFFYVSVNGNTTAGYNRPVIAVQEVVNQGFSGSGKVFATAGQTIDIRATNAAGSISSFGTFQIERISGPSQIAASESVSALYTGAPPTGTLNGSENLITFGTKVKDSHNAYVSGIYTIPVSGTYSISAYVGLNITGALNNETDLSVYIDGVAKYYGSRKEGGATTSTWVNLSVHSIPLLAGQLIGIRIATQATSPTFRTAANENYFSIVRTGNY